MRVNQLGFYDSRGKWHVIEGRVIDPAQTGYEMGLAFRRWLKRWFGWATS